MDVTSSNGSFPKVQAPTKLTPVDTVKKSEKAPHRQSQPYSFSGNQLTQTKTNFRTPEQVIAKIEATSSVDMSSQGLDMMKADVVPEKLMLCMRPHKEMQHVPMHGKAAKVVMAEINKHRADAVEPGTMGAMLFNIKGGGQASLTSVRDNQGNIKTNLNKDKYQDVVRKVDQFHRFTKQMKTELGQQGIPLDTPINLYRGFASLSLSQMQVGQTFQDTLPSSTSLSESFSKSWQTENAVLIRIPVTLGYPMVMMDYPPDYMGISSSDPQPIGLKGQFESIIAPSTYTIKSKTVENGVTIFEVEAIPLTEQESMQKIYDARDIAFPPPPKVVNPVQASSESMLKEIAQLKEKPPRVLGVLIREYEKNLPGVDWSKHTAELVTLGAHFKDESQKRDFKAMEKSSIYLSLLKESSK